MVADNELFRKLSKIIPLSTGIQIDILTDLGCPISFLSQTKLQTAIRLMGLEGQVRWKFHPIFIDPNFPKEGENLDDYLLRNRGWSKEFAHSDDNPIRKAGRAAGINFNPHRRVINTVDTFRLLEVAQRQDLQEKLAKVLARRYFEEAQNISEEEVLLASAAECGMSTDRALAEMRSPEICEYVQQRHVRLSERLGEVPHFLLREYVSGQGVEIGGNRSVDDWMEVLDSVIRQSRCKERVQSTDTTLFEEFSNMFPLSTGSAGSGLQRQTRIQVDILTDIGDPISFMSQTKLEAAFQRLGLEGKVQWNFHPNFVDPDVAKEGENLDDYLLRERGWSKEHAHSEDNAIHKAGQAAGIKFNPNRRVINTFDAFCLLEVSQRQDLQEKLVKVLGRRYFEEAQDISDEAVLLACAAECGIPEDKALVEMHSPEIRAYVHQRYDLISQQLGEIPHFLLRDNVSGQGTEIIGNRSVDEWIEVLQPVIQQG